MSDDNDYMDGWIDGLYGRNDITKQYSFAYQAGQKMTDHNDKSACIGSMPIGPTTPANTNIQSNNVNVDERGALALIVLPFFCAFIALSFWTYPITFLLTVVLWYLLCLGLSFVVAALNTLFFVNPHYLMTKNLKIDLITLPIDIISLDIYSPTYNWPGIILGTISALIIFYNLWGREKKWGKNKIYWAMRHIWRIVLPGLALYFVAYSVNYDAYCSSAVYKNYWAIDKIRLEKISKYERPIFNAFYKNKISREQLYKKIKQLEKKIYLKYPNPEPDKTPFLYINTIGLQPMGLYILIIASVVISHFGFKYAKNK